MVDAVAKFQARGRLRKQNIDVGEVLLGASRVSRLVTADLQTIHHLLNITFIQRSIKQVRRVRLRYFNLQQEQRLLRKKVGKCREREKPTD